MALYILETLQGIRNQLEGLTVCHVVVTRYPFYWKANQNNLWDGIVAIAILVIWMQFACLISVERHGGKLYHVCFTNCVVLTLTNWLGMFHLNAMKNLSLTFWLICSNIEAKEKIYSPLFPIMELRYKRYSTYGIRARLKRSDLMDSSTYRYVFNYVIWLRDIIVHTIKIYIYCWTLCMGSKNYV